MGSDRWGINEDIPCFWLGGKAGPQWMQVNMRANTTPQSGGEAIEVDKLNKTRQALHEYFCDTPMRLQSLEKRPQYSERALISDGSVRGKRPNRLSDDEIAANQVQGWY